MWERGKCDNVKNGFRSSTCRASKGAWNRNTATMAGHHQQQRMYGTWCVCTPVCTTTFSLCWREDGHQHVAAAPEGHLPPIRLNGLVLVWLSFFWVEGRRVGWLVGNNRQGQAPHLVCTTTKLQGRARRARSVSCLRQTLGRCTPQPITQTTRALALYMPSHPTCSAVVALMFAGPTTMRARLFMRVVSSNMAFMCAFLSRWPNSCSHMSAVAVFERLRRCVASVHGLLVRCVSVLSNFACMCALKKSMSACTRKGAVGVATQQNST